MLVGDRVRGRAQIWVGMERGEVWRMVMLVMVFCLIAGARAEIYLARFAGTPAVYYDGSIEGFAATGVVKGGPRIDPTSAHVQSYRTYLERSHDRLLGEVFKGETYTKIYSYSFLVNGVALDITDEQAEKLRIRSEVVYLSKDRMLKTVTSYTPDYLGLPSGIWKDNGGIENAGEGMVIGLVDTGIDPTHPSFADTPPNSYAPIASFRGSCEIMDTFPEGSCNNKLIGARHFVDAAIAAGRFNASNDFASPLDGEGHGTHTASTAAGNNGVPIVVKGFNFGKSSGIAPRARLSIYKCLYRYIGGFLADCVAGIEQAVEDNIDVLSLSIGPPGPPQGVVYLDIFDVALLAAFHTGVVVVQASGNSGPDPVTVLSYGPWIVSVAAAKHDRTYPNHITLGDQEVIPGTGFARGTNGTSVTLVLAEDAHYKDSMFRKECQDKDSMRKELVSGRILICEYNWLFVVSEVSISKAFETAKQLDAAGVLFVLSSELSDFSVDPFPLGDTLPGAMVETYELSEKLITYYNRSTTRTKSGEVTHFGATAEIEGGSTAVYSGEAPVVTVYSSRGPAINNQDYDLADILKPNILAPGHSIWASWSTVGTEVRQFLGEKFSLISGTSMATPHIAGIAALLKQKHPTWSPAAVASALATTVDISSKTGKPLMAEHPSTNLNQTKGVAGPFDFGSGYVNAHRSVDPGLVFEADIKDYAEFMCHIPNVTSEEVENATGLACPKNLIGYASDLNAPSIVIANLQGSRYVPRVVTNVANVTETYKVRIITPNTFNAIVVPFSFTIAPSESYKLIANITSHPPEAPPKSSFGYLFLDGDQGHTIRIPISLVYAEDFYGIAKDFIS